MATITTLANPLRTGLAPAMHSNQKFSYHYWEVVDLAAVTTAKGSAIANGDVIEVLRVPNNTLIEFAWCEKITALTGTSTDFTLSLGVTGVAAGNYVAGWNASTAAVPSYGNPQGVHTPIILAASDTIDLLVTAQTGTVTGGKIVVGAILADMVKAPRPGVVPLKS